MLYIPKKKAGSDTQPGKDSLAEVCASPTLERKRAPLAEVL